VTDSDRLVFSGRDPLLEEVMQIPGVSVAHRTDRLCVLYVNHDTLEAVLPNTKFGWAKMFERTYFAPTLDEETRTNLVRDFFDWLSMRYESEVDIQRNIKCYETLFERACKLSTLTSRISVLDVGCGPGTIMMTRIPAVTSELYGYDIGGDMRRCARSMGLSVMSEHEFLSGENRFQIALSAYVMHYACDLRETIQAVQRQLIPGGSWAVNFHKGMNLRLFLDEISLSNLELASGPEESSFGPLVEVVLL
jgi:predicted TPR repeat methyltransferase